MNQNYPQMTTPATAPEFGGNKTLNPEKTLLPSGLQPAVIFAVVDLGTHMESYQGNQPEPKRKIMVGFEFPQLKQKYYLEDEKARSCMITKESTFIISDKSFLKSLISGIYGRNFTDQECRNFDVMQLVNMKILANVIHTQIKSGPNMGKIKESIASVSALGNYPLPLGFEPELPLQSFYIDPQGNNFLTSNFANLMPWIKKKIYQSQEAEARKGKGLPFAKSQEEIERETQNQPASNSYQTQTNYQAQNPSFGVGSSPTSAYSQNGLPTPPAPPIPQANIPKVIMLNNHNYNAFISNGWTDDMLIQHGYAVLNPDFQQNQNPQIPQAPQAVPQAPQAPQAIPQATAQQPLQSGVSNPFIDDEDDDLPF